MSRKEKAAWALLDLDIILNYCITLKTPPILQDLLISLELLNKCLTLDVTGLPLGIKNSLGLLKSGLEYSGSGLAFVKTTNESRKTALRRYHSVVQ